MKIALCGVSSTGKSVLARQLSQKLTLPLVHEGMKDLRIVYKERGEEIPHFRDQNEVQRLKYQIELIKYRLDREFQFDHFVADGSALDMIAWYRTCAFLVPENYKIETLKGLTIAARNYDYVFYLPFGVIPVEDDGRRMIDMVNLETVDMVLKGVIAQAATTVMKDKIWILNEITIESRVKAVLSIVKPELAEDVQDADLTLIAANKRLDIAEVRRVLARHGLPQDDESVQDALLLEDLTAKIVEPGSGGTIQ